MMDTRDFEKAADALEKAGFEKAAGRTTAWAARRIVNLVRRNVRAEMKHHRRTGRMRDRVRTRFKGFGLGMEAGVKTTGAASNLIVGGVRPHQIIAEGKVMPLWVGRGKAASVQGYARVVEHPGFGADPFFFRGHMKSLPEINVILNKSAETMAAELAYRMRGRS
jgi:hypothetical protein